tara:strand:+ start:67 stop:351 length:285 start_codon:yes stop_codon:yes gene_type:complete
MSKIRKLTPSLLRKIVLEEKRRIIRENDPIEAGIEDPEKVDAEETDADEYADSIEKDIDFMKVLKIQERKLKRKMKRIQEAKKIIRSRVTRRLG